MLDPKTHQLQCEQIAVGGFLGKALCSWWIFRKSSSQLVDFYLEGSTVTSMKPTKSRHTGNISTRESAVLTVELPFLST